MLGVRQSGMQAFKFARLPEDVELLERARRGRARSSTTTREAGLAHPLLADALLRAYGPDAVAPIPVHHVDRTDHSSTDPSPAPPAATGRRGRGGGRR